MITELDLLHKIRLLLHLDKCSFSGI